MASGCHCWHGTARVTPMSSVCKARTPGKSKQRQVEAYIFTSLFRSFQAFHAVPINARAVPNFSARLRENSNPSLMPQLYSEQE